MKTSVRGTVRTAIQSSIKIAGSAASVPANALKIDGVPVTIDGDYIIISSE